MSRLRKAFRYQMIGPFSHEAGVVFAPNAGLARADLYRKLIDCDGVSWRHFLMACPSMLRDPGSDIHLPDRHPMAAALSEPELDAVVHAFGGRYEGAGSRSHFSAGAEDGTLHWLVSLGMFTSYPAPPETRHPNGSIFSAFTDLGKAVAAGEQAPYPKWMEARLAKRRAALAGRAALEKGK